MTQCINMPERGLNLSVHRQVADTAKELDKNCIYISHAVFGGHLANAALNFQQKQNIRNEHNKLRMLMATYCQVLAHFCIYL